jgi:hypothetical protein
MKSVLLPLLFLAVAPVQAADRIYYIGDFDRIRVEGPFDVRLATRGNPAAHVTGSAPASLELQVDAGVLVVRARQDVTDAARTGAAFEPPVIYLRTTDLHSATVIGGGKLDITGPVRAQRVDLQVSGAGTIAALGLDAEQLNATLIGNGQLTLGGRAGTARLLSSGAGMLEATALRADTLRLRLDGSGTARASARRTADVATSGLGAATVYGTAKCKVHAAAGGPIACGVTLAAGQ